VKVDGEELEVPEEELLSGYSRTAKFTKQSMALADQRRAFEAERQAATARESQINAFFRDPANIARYYEELTGKTLTPAQATAIANNTPPASSPNADDFATNQSVVAIAQQEARTQAAQLSQQVQEHLNRQLAATQEWTANAIQTARMEAEQQRIAVEYHGEINNTVSALMKEYPVLAAVDDIENVMCVDAQRMGPSNIEEARQALTMVAKARAEKLTAHFKEMQKASAVERAKLQTSGIEPPGGTGVAPTAQHYKLGDKGLANAAADWMDKHSKQK
jgi:hypothetical protein